MKTYLQPGDLKECDARFDAIFKLTTAASKIIDSDLTILNINDALTDLLGYYSAGELVGSKILDYTCEADKQHWHELQDAMWHKGKPDFQFDACIIEKDGNLAWVRFTTMSFIDDGIYYAYTVLDDFTALKQLRESEMRLTMALNIPNGSRGTSPGGPLDQPFGWLRGTFRLQR